ncbi:MAG TPA: S8 family serine peptidase [Thermoanaerobaculia bacterium]
MSRLLLALLFFPSLAFADTRYLVEFRGEPSTAQFERFRHDATVALGKRGVEEVKPRHELSRVFHGVALTLDDASAAAVRRLPYVAALHEDKEMQLFGTDVTHLERIGAKQVWTNLGARGDGVTIAVIDSGVDRTHPAFAGRYAGGYDFIELDDEPQDPHGHGTHVAGTALGETFGVAPAAKLLAYRVMDATGHGVSSDVMAAMERAIEDGADVINLSLGSIFGDADAPEARAVDRAVEAGVVVVLAAGNFGGALSIGAPATSRRGIAVGNMDSGDRILYDSSYGPVFPELDLKPDLSAPGEEIVSARSGGGTRVMSGTSMASPHVAGAAALLLDLHPEWTPDQVKAALIASAEPTADEVSKRGGGRLDVHRAAQASAFVSPASLAFGRMRGTDEEWTATRTVRITANETKTFQWRTGNPACLDRTQDRQDCLSSTSGITITVEPSTFTLAAGESRDVTITLRAKDLPPTSNTLTFGGSIDFGETRIPWIFVHAASVNTVIDPSASLIWSCGADFLGRPALYRDPRTLLPLRKCAAIVSIPPAGTDPGAVILDERTIRADETIAFTPDHAPYRLELGGVDEEGRPLHAQSGYTSLVRIDFGPSRIQQYLYFPQVPRLSAMPEDVAIRVTEVVADLANQRVVGVQHAPLQGLRGDRTLVNASTELTRTRVTLPPSVGEFFVAPVDSDRAFGTIVAHAPLASGWTGDVWVTPSKTPDYVAGPGFATHFYVSAPITADAVLGTKPLFPRLELLTKETRFGFSTEFVGPAGERHHTVSPRYEARDASGVVVQQGSVEPFTVVDHAGPGAYTLTLRGNGAGVTTFAFDTRRADPIPPSLTSARIAGDDVVFTASEAVTSKVSHIDGQIRLEIVDTAGNSCTWTAPSNDGLSKRRTSRH